MMPPTEVLVRVAGGRLSIGSGAQDTEAHYTEPERRIEGDRHKTGQTIEDEGAVYRAGKGNERNKPHNQNTGAGQPMPVASYIHQGKGDAQEKKGTRRLGGHPYDAERCHEEHIFQALTVTRKTRKDGQTGKHKQEADYCKASKSAAFGTGFGEEQPERKPGQQKGDGREWIHRFSTGLDHAL